MDLVINKGVGLDEVIKLIVYLLPSFLILTIPMSLLLAILITLGRLAADGELIAMRASGVSLYQILAPFLALCVVGFIITNLVTLFLLPEGNRAFRSHLFNLSKKHSEANLQERIFNDDFEGLIIYINEIPGKGQHMKGILISDKRVSAVPSLVIGEEGMIISDQDSLKVTLRLFNGSIHRTARDSVAYQKATFDTYDMNLALSGDESEQESEISYRDMGITNLIKLINEREKANKSSVRIQTEFHKRFSIPFACMVVGLMGIPVGAYRKKGSRSYGFVLCMIVLFLYYLLLNIGESMAKRGILPPFWGMWMPNIILGILGIYFLRVVGREYPLPFISWLDEKVTVISGLLKRKLEKI
jgi:lipopolysaccharide export system permease protein